jgi:arsenical-resistance protein 2
MRHIISTLILPPLRTNKSQPFRVGQRLKMSTADATPAPAPWYAAYPAPKSEVVTISREEVLKMLKSTPVEKRDFVLVDLRRNDFEVS